jgi:uracil-DNA glycosylase family 4
MSRYQSGLDLVVKALTQIGRDQERLPRASRVSLSQLHRKALRVVDDPEVASPRIDPSNPETASSSDSDRIRRLEAIRARVLPCTKCPHLVRSRTQTVFGVGNPDADLMFIGEAPGADEDRQGEPFVGRAGQLLTKMIVAMGFARTDVYIANILKCRPDMPAGSSGNRAPTPEEMQTCLPYLTEQIEIIKPKVMVGLGATAVEGLLGTRGAMRELRGKWHSYHKTPLMITYHPSYLLRNQTLSERRKVWEDMLQVLEELGRPITEKQRNYFRS